MHAEICRYCEDTTTHTHDDALQLCSVKVIRVSVEQVSKAAWKCWYGIRNVLGRALHGLFDLTLCITSRDLNGKYTRTGVEQATIYTSISTSPEHTTRSHLTPLPNYNDRIG